MLVEPEDICISSNTQPPPLVRTSLPVPRTAVSAVSWSLLTKVMWTFPLGVTLPTMCMHADETSLPVDASLIWAAVWPQK